MPKNTLLAEAFHLAEETWLEDGSCLPMDECPHGIPMTSGCPKCQRPDLSTPSGAELDY